MNTQERRRRRRKPQSGGVKKAYARIGGKIIEVEMIDDPAPKNQRTPITLDENGNTIEVTRDQKTERHRDFRSLAEAILGQIFKS